ncbi:MAG: HD domain-containing protein [Acidimicrobiales bacterium]
MAVTPDLCGGKAADSSSSLGERAETWAATMEGYEHLPRGVLGGPGVRTAHEGTVLLGAGFPVMDRRAREELEDETLARGATRAEGPGNRLHEEEPDEWRTCFERDRDRILHSAAFRRLAGKTQVFIFPADHQRTRLTHALEVAQVAVAIARACRLNVPLAEAIALGHDCGHGPGGHASEDALSPFVEGGFDHAVWGADVTAAGLNLCQETLDGIRNHSWSRPRPCTPEGEVAALADRIAYTAHDLEDAVHAGIVDISMLPEVVTARCGPTRSSQLRCFIGDVVATTRRAGFVAMSEPMAEALAELRRFDYELIYLRRSSVEQSQRVIDMLRALVEHFSSHPGEMPAEFQPTGSIGAVAYVAGMTDRFACSQAIARLNWSRDRLPRGAD